MKTNGEMSRFMEKGGKYKGKGKYSKGKGRFPYGQGYEVQEYESHKGFGKGKKGFSKSKMLEKKKE